MNRKSEFLERVEAGLTGRQAVRDADAALLSLAVERQQAIDGFDQREAALLDERQRADAEYHAGTLALAHLESAAGKPLGKSAERLEHALRNGNTKQRDELRAALTA